MKVYAVLERTLTVGDGEVWCNNVLINVVGDLNAAIDSLAEMGYFKDENYEPDAGTVWMSLVLGTRSQGFECYAYIREFEV